MSQPNAAQVLAVDADALDDAEHVAALAVLAADIVLLETVKTEVERAEEILDEMLDQTPAGVLSSLPGIGVVRASTNTDASPQRPSSTRFHPDLTNRMVAMAVGFNLGRRALR